MNDIKSKLPGQKFEAGVYTADRLKDSLIHSFRHGKVRGETTHIPQLDSHFSWKKGELTCVTGWPQSGKSEFTMFMTVLKAVHKNWKWAIYSPENMSVDHQDQLTAGEIFDTIIHMVMGKSTDPRYVNRMTEREYIEALGFVSERFFVVYPEEGQKQDDVNEHLVYLTKKHRLDGWIKDPWNALEDDYGSREDQFLRRALDKECKLAKRHKVCNVVVAHPAGRPVVSDGILLPADQYSLSGGAMWNNKCDNICVGNRPNVKTNPADTTFDFSSLKIKKQKLVGVPGTITLHFDRPSNRYYDINGQTFLSFHVIQDNPSVNSFPHSGNVDF